LNSNGNQVVNLNPLNNANINNNINQNVKERKVPIKIIKKENEKKDSSSNFNALNIVSNQNNRPVSSNNIELKKNKKMEELNQKINDFDLKLNIESSKKSHTPSEKAEKRPLTPLERENNIKDKKKSINEDKEYLLDEFKIYNINKKLIDANILDKPNIQMIENAPMIIPKSNKNELRATNIFLQDDKGCTDFFKDVFYILIFRY
jgi:hypothetical protein